MHSYAIYIQSSIPYLKYGYLLDQELKSKSDKLDKEEAEEEEDEESDESSEVSDGSGSGYGYRKTRQDKQRERDKRREERRKEKYEEKHRHKHKNKSNKPKFMTRACRAKKEVSYKFEDYDDLINTAIVEETEKAYREGRSC